MNISTLIDFEWYFENNIELEICEPIRKQIYRKSLIGLNRNSIFHFLSKKVYLPSFNTAQLCFVLCLDKSFHQSFDKNISQTLN